jgi:mRNA interferase RelE/StbE
LGWRIELSGDARKQLQKLGRPEAKRIVQFLHQRLEPLDDPRQLGKSLKGPFTELWRYRVGDYRLICELRDEVLVVLVLRVGHRSRVYRN